MTSQLYVVIRGNRCIGREQLPNPKSLVTFSLVFLLSLKTVTGYAYDISLQLHQHTLTTKSRVFYAILTRMIFVSFFHKIALPDMV